jgi:hypothetical protein
VTRSPRGEPPFDPRVVRAVATAIRPSPAIPADPFGGVDPADFTYLARYWHVAPALWLTLRQRSDLPMAVQDALRTEYWRNVRVNARLRAAAGELVTALNAAGIVPMLLKGGCQLFDPPSGHAGTRFMVDLDVLVPQGQDRVSFDTLSRSGFVPEADGDRTHHWPRLTKPFSGLDDGLAIEVHRTPWFEGGVEETGALFAASVPIPGLEGGARLPCTMHRLINNVAHAFPAEGPFSYYAVSEPDDFDEAVGCTDLKQLLDFAELCHFRGDELDWDHVLAEAERFGQRYNLQQWSFLARALFAVPVPNAVAAWHVDRQVPRTLLGRSRRLAKSSLRRAGLLDAARRMRSWWIS